VRPEIFEDSVWQMSLGERAGVEGVLSQLSPSLALEIGSAEGACVRRIAAHAEEVHSFDLDPPSLPLPGNVTQHTGDSHELLTPFLAELAQLGRNVDFVMIDGDHTPEGVRRDIEDLLDSRAIARTVILVHDIANERVRRGADAVRFAAWPKVAHVELDWIPGRLFAEPALRNELWYGLGLVIVDASRPAYLNGSVYEQRYHPAAPLLAQVRDLVVAREQVPPGTQTLGDEANALREQAAALEDELGGERHRAAGLEAELGNERHRAATLEAELEAARHRIAGAERALENIKGSVSWRMTEPLRGTKRRVRRSDG
jgi:hypothetical protein